MHWIVRAVVVLLMTGNARRISAGQVVIAIHVTRRTRDRCMGASQSEAGGRVIECAIPPVSGGMALITRLREPRLHVIGIRGALKIL